MSTLPVIDLFAGCGGFSEGFARYSSGHNRFEIVAAVDNNVHANTTHTLRQVFHQFEVVPEEYYELLRGKLTLNEFYGLFEEQHEKAHCAMLSRISSLGTMASGLLAKPPHSAARCSATAGNGADRRIPS